MSAESYRLILMDVYKKACLAGMSASSSSELGSSLDPSTNLEALEIVNDSKESVPERLKKLFLNPMNKRHLFVTKYQQMKLQKSN